MERVLFFLNFFKFKKNLREISEMCRFCPNKNCNMLIEATIEGCNHMECTNCKTHFCWICESFKVFLNFEK